MKLVAMTAECLMGVLFLCVSVRAQSTLNMEVMKQAAKSWQGALPCGKWDCDCAFSRQPGCCCVANQATQLEEYTFMRTVRMWDQLSSLQSEIEYLTGNVQISFTAALSARQTCFGPFTTNVPIPYTSVSLNQGYGYNPALGVFTAPRTGAYSFSLTVYSNVGLPTERLYHKIQMMKDGQVLTSVWEDNREDMEDSGFQNMVVSLKRGCQVYIELVAGRSLCGNIKEYNFFSGFLLYPLSDA